MSTPMTNKYDGADLPLPTYQKSIHDSNGTSKDTPYPKQENVTGAYPQVIPDLMVSFFRSPRNYFLCCMDSHKIIK